MTVMVGILFAGAVVVAMAGGVAWGHWASRRYTDLLIGWERDARKREYASLEKKLAQRFEQHVDDTDSRIDALEQGAITHLRSQARKLTNATATARRVRHGRDQLRDENASLRDKLKQRIRSDSSTQARALSGTPQ